MKISVIIPTLQAARYLPSLVFRLNEQSIRPAEILIVDSSSSDGTVQIARETGCRIHTIQRSEFNHGGTRNLGARLAEGDILVFMTQDSLPANPHFLEELTRTIREGKASAACARQLPYADAFPPEVFARKFNYPESSHVKTLTDVEHLGIKAFFFSNVASAVDSRAFVAVGGFPESVILNEDMLLCARLLHAGHTVAYCGDAQVFHSHNYHLSQQFRRYFDIGVSIAQARDLLEGGDVGGEGARFFLQQIRYLIKHGAWGWIPHAAGEAGLKLLAFQLGKRERYLSISLKRKLSMHPFYWA